jgi:hypothetical protein
MRPMPATERCTECGTVLASRRAAAVRARGATILVAADGSPAAAPASSASFSGASRAMSCTTLHAPVLIVRAPIATRVA